jgi:hypothetical protein
VKYSFRVSGMKGMGSLGSGIAEKLILFSPMDTQLEVRALECSGLFKQKLAEPGVNL